MLDGVVVYERTFFSRAWPRPWLWPALIARALRLVRELRALRPQVSVDWQGNLKGALLARLSGAPRRIGLAARQGGKERSHWFATEKVVLPPPTVHRADRARALLGPLEVPVSSTPPQVGGVAEARATVRNWLEEKDIEKNRYVVLHPGTSGFGLMKRWPPERFGELAAMLGEEHGLPVLVTAGPGEEPLADAVVASSGGAAQRGPETKSLAELGALLESAGLVVGADTGPVHLAAVLAAPTVALFGPKDPSTYAPRGPATRTVWKQVWCSPCRLRRCDDPVCMTTMRVDEVLPHAEALLTNGRKQG
jgi:ADP-heptose:LPS heptosyltransferase